MKVLEFYFDDLWDMEASCGDEVNESENPAPVTPQGIYIIHNANESGVKSQTYVGYAKNARHRWGGRYETLHCLGVPASYGKNILCAFCVPTIGNKHAVNLDGLNACEHALMRAVVNGMLGKTTCTNTTLSRTKFFSPEDLDIRVYFHNIGPKWGSLENEKRIKIKQGVGY